MVELDFTSNFRSASQTNQLKNGQSEIENLPTEVIEIMWPRWSIMESVKVTAQTCTDTASLFLIRPCVPYAAIFNFRSCVPHTLTLELGESVRILEKCQGNSQFWTKSSLSTPTLRIVFISCDNWHNFPFFFWFGMISVWKRERASHDVRLPQTSLFFSGWFRGYSCRKSNVKVRKGPLPLLPQDSLVIYFPRLAFLFI